MWIYRLNFERVIDHRPFSEDSPYQRKNNGEIQFWC